MGLAGASRATQSRTSEVSVPSCLLINPRRLPASRGVQVQRIKKREAVRPSVGKIRQAQSTQRGTGEDGKAKPGGMSEGHQRTRLCALQTTGDSERVSDARDSRVVRGVFHSVRLPRNGH